MTHKRYVKLSTVSTVLNQVQFKKSWNCTWSEILSIRYCDDSEHSCETPSKWPATSGATQIIIFTLHYYYYYQTQQFTDLPPPNMTIDFNFVNRPNWNDQ